MKPIVLFGAGSLGKLTWYALKQKGVQVAYFCDNDIDKQGTFYCGIKVVSPKEVPPDSRIIICNNYMAGEDCISLLEGVDFSDCGLDAERIIGLHKADVKCVDVVITERCSMKCKDCANLMQYYKQPKDCDLDVLFEALDNLTKYVDVYEFRVLGGEPFVCKNLYKVIDKLRTYGRNIVIYTNATIVPKEPARLKGVKFDITNYGHKNHKKLLDVLDANGIEYTTYKPTEWTDSGSVKFRGHTEQRLNEMFANCCVKDVLTLLHGKLYHCPFSAHAHNLGLVVGDYADMSGKESIMNFCKRKEYLTACKYCKGRDYGTPKIKPAIQRDNTGVAAEVS